MDQGHGDRSVALFGVANENQSLRLSEFIRSRFSKLEAPPCPEVSVLFSLRICPSIFARLKK